MSETTTKDEWQVADEIVKDMEGAVSTSTHSVDRYIPTQDGPHCHHTDTYTDCEDTEFELTSDELKALLSLALYDRHIKIDGELREIKVVSAPAIKFVFTAE